MKKARVVVFCTVIILLITSFWGCSEKDITVFDDGELSVTPDPSKYINVALKDEGLCVYSPMGAGGYRYGPSLITNNDGSLDAWFAGPGSNGQWDWIYYRRSSDGGATWSQEQVVLMGTSGSRDGQSVCDPGVIKIGKYYYLGYTSTVYNQVCNSVFVARSENPNGPFEKWGGEGWSCEAFPIVYYDEDPSKFGCGEPSFVVKGNVLYIYVNWISSAGQFTKVYTADATSENWPATMEYKGDAISHRPGDSLDVKYIEDYGKFIGICTTDRMGEDSKLTFYQSDDGLSFTRCTDISENTGWGSHNAGISARPNGHIRLSDEIYVGYAYGSAWANWSTRLHKIDLSLGDKPYEAISSKAVDFTDASTYIVGKEDSVTGIYGEDVRLMSGDTRTVAMLKLNKYCEALSFTEDDVKAAEFKIWDESVAEVNPETGEVKGLKPGKTFITVKYQDFTYSMAVYVFDNKEDYYQQSRKAVSFEPSVITDYEISLSYDAPKQIRGMLYYSDGTFAEIGEAKYLVEDTSVCYVDRNGYIRPKAAGSTEVTVSYGDVGEFKVNVKITE